MNAFVTVAACNFDDVLMGVYPSTKEGKAAAMSRGKAVAKNPELRHVEHQANDTEMLCARVFLCQDSTKFTEVAEFELGGKRTRKVKTKR